MLTGVVVLDTLFLSWSWEALGVNACQVSQTLCPTSRPLSPETGSHAILDSVASRVNSHTMPMTVDNNIQSVDVDSSPQGWYLHKYGRYLPLPGSRYL